MIDIATPGAAAVRGQLSVPSAFGDVGVFVGDGVAWLSGAGLRTVDVSDPANPRLVQGAEILFPARRIALNGSGLGVLVPGGSDFLQVYDTSDPGRTSNFLAQFVLTSTARDVAIGQGLAYVGGADRLEVVNYRPFDADGQAPTVSLTTSVTDIDPDTAGIQVVEGTPIPLLANVSDDVQVRNVELLVDGVVVRNHVSFPFDFTTTAPRNLPAAGTVSLQVRNGHRRQQHALRRADL